MNTTTPIVPAYLVIAFDPTAEKRQTNQLFKESSLLASRNAALQHIQRLQANPLRPYPLTITLQLVESNRTVIPALHKLICIVYEGQFQPNLILPTASTNNNRTEPAKPIQAEPVYNIALTTRELSYYQTHSYDTGIV